jgi:glutamyl-tRNA(Gln) amidotransferase subunit E
MKKDIKITCGLEIHQQLEGKKLFCDCPTIIKDGSPDFCVERKLRAVVGETGLIDSAAVHESKIGKKFVYECFNDNVCLVDVDEAPPGNLNNDCLLSSLQVCKMLSAEIVDEVQVMRKIVVDGSNTAGFQRTALVGLNGKLKTSKGFISIPSIIIEEDSARTISRSDDSVVYRLDRLGIPLFEITTGPDIHSSEHCAEVAEKIGLLLRSTGKCKRGIGTIRQDVNVSVEGGARVEIKGAQDLKLIKNLVDNEVNRQSALLNIKDELKKRNVIKKEIVIFDVSSFFSGSESKLIKRTLHDKGKILAVKLSGFAGLLGLEIQKGKRLGTELSSRAKVKAGVGGIFHSDELPAYGITDKEVDSILVELKCDKERDAFVLCADSEIKARLALSAVVERVNECLLGVPQEVRDANPDATSTYLRPMPGSARMYPETDVLPVRISADLLKAIKIPESIEKKKERFKKLGLANDLADSLARSQRADFFDVFFKKFKNVKPAFIAEVLVSVDKVVRREFNVEISPSEEDFSVFFSELNNGRIDKSCVNDLFKQAKPVSLIIKDFYLLSDVDVENFIKEFLDKNKDIPLNALMGKVMSNLRGKASGEKVNLILKKLLKKL